jgi:hypothetical protein
MPQAQTMTDEEKVTTAYKAFELLDAGDREGYSRLMKSIPLPPYLAKIAKEKIGMDFLLDRGWNLSEVEAEFGPDWLSR